MRPIKFRGKDVNTGEWLYWQFGDGNGDTFKEVNCPRCLAAIEYIKSLK